MACGQRWGLPMRKPRAVCRGKIRPFLMLTINPPPPKKSSPFFLPRAHYFFFYYLFSQWNKSFSCHCNGISRRSPPPSPPSPLPSAPIHSFVFQVHPRVWGSSFGKHKQVMSLKSFEQGNPWANELHKQLQSFGHLIWLLNVHKCC